MAITNFLFRDSIGQFIQSNILFTYFYVALYCILIEEIIRAVKKRNWKHGLLALLGIAATCVPHYLFEFLMNLHAVNYLELKYIFLYNDVVASFVCSPLSVEYTWLFVIMGIVMYFAGTKQRKAAVLALFSVICFVGNFIPGMAASSLHTVIGFTQACMILAVPFMLLYNGEKGRGSKYFFYVYYPLHRYVISIAVYIYQVFFST